MAIYRPTKKKIKEILESSRPKRTRTKIGDRPISIRAVNKYKEKLRNQADTKISKIDQSQSD